MKKKEMSSLEAMKTLLAETVKIAKLKPKIADRKETNAAWHRMHKGQARAGDSLRLAQAKAESMARGGK